MHAGVLSVAMTTPIIWVRHYDSYITSFPKYFLSYQNKRENRELVELKRTKNETTFL